MTPRKRRMKLPAAKPTKPRPSYKDLVPHDGATRLLAGKVIFKVCGQTAILIKITSLSQFDGRGDEPSGFCKLPKNRLAFVIGDLVTLRHDTVGSPYTASFYPRENHRVIVLDKPITEYSPKELAKAALDGFREVKKNDPEVKKFSEGIAGIGAAVKDLFNK